ncbi:Lymphoid enhancer-binding factor 1 [Channa argus]|uniref:Lymphoid enhancer-binding factor 1 n=1 Tax=Channa argus TaxID=215402 RepID=A0A6G1Q5T6_CHAAH|nr:Lymphoid enhancer-binding factor 1 [Channa argus]
MRIDIREEFDRTVKQIEWVEVLDTLQAVIEDALGVTPNTSPSTPPPPALPTELGFDILPQPVGDVHEAPAWCSSYHLGIAPSSLEEPVTTAQTIMQAGSLYGQEGVYSQGQHTLHQSAVNDHPGPPTAACYPAAPPHTNNNAPGISSYKSTGQNLVPLQLLQLVKTKRKYNKPQDNDQPYIKKPLNAFMLFMKEQRQSVVAEINIRDNAAVNTVLGQRNTLDFPVDKLHYEQTDVVTEYVCFQLPQRHNILWRSN